MEFLCRVAIKHAKRERTGSSLLSSLVLSLHTSTEDLCSKFVPCKSSSIKLSTCKSTFACAITSVSSQIWHKFSWAHPRQLGVLLCTLLYRTVWSTISASRSVWPDSLRPHRPQPTRLHCPWDFSSKDTGVHCHFLLQGIFATKGLNPGVLSCRQILYQLSYKGSPQKTSYININFLYKYK